MTSSLRRLGLAALVVTGCASAAAAAPWPHWLGPSRNGVSAESGLMSTWTKAAEPRKIWEKKLGNGFSGISVVGDRLYTLYADATNDFAVCLDAKTGARLWRRSLDAIYEDSMGGDGPRSTPTVVGDTVYVLGARGGLVALATADGRQKWKRELVSELGGRLPKWGYSQSLLVHDGKVFVDPGGAAGKGLLALDATTGATVWQSDEVIAGYSTPAPYTVGGVAQVLFFTGQELVSVSPNDGAAHWRQEWETSWDINAATPLFMAPDKVFISSGYGNGGALYEVKAAAGKVSARELWRTKTMKNKMATSVPLGDMICGLSESDLTCMSTATGDELWSQEDVGLGTLIAADGHLLVLDEECTLRLVAQDKGKYIEQGRLKVLGDRCWTAPTLADGRLYLRDEVGIIALDVRAAAP